MTVPAPGEGPVRPVSVSLHARRASRLLAAAGLHGHKYALEAIVAATALTAPAPATILTSDPDELRTLCGSGVRVIKI